MLLCLTFQSSTNYMCWLPNVKGWDHSNSPKTQWISCISVSSVSNWASNCKQIKQLFHTLHENQAKMWDFFFLFNWNKEHKVHDLCRSKRPDGGFVTQPLKSMCVQECILAIRCQQGTGRLCTLLFCSVTWSRCSLVPCCCLEKNSYQAFIRRFTDCVVQRC